MAIVLSTRVLRWTRYEGVAIRLLPILAIASCWVLIAARWHSGDSLPNAIAGLFPVSDAHGYWQCAVAFGHQGTQGLGQLGIDSDWCARRIVYPAFLAGALKLTGGSPAAALLLQGAVVAFAIAATAATAFRRGALVGLLVLFLLFDFAYHHALGLFMTEVFGLSASLFSIPLLASAIDKQSRTRLFLGLGLLSLAMASRSGALLVFPFLLAWSAWTSRRWGPAPLLSGLMCLAALISGFLLQRLMLHAMDMNPSASFGNFSTVLFRMSVGAGSWHAVYAHHADLFRLGLPEPEVFAAIYHSAFENIRAHPGVLVETYFREAAKYLRAPLSFDELAGSGFLLSMTLLGLLKCLRNFRDPFALLLLCVAVGEILSVPLLYADGGARVFAATVGFRALIAGIGLKTAVETAFRLLDEGIYRDGKRYGLRLCNAADRRIALCALAAMAATLALPEPPMLNLALASGFALLVHRLDPARPTATTSGASAEPFRLAAAGGTAMVLLAMLSVAGILRFGAPESLAKSACPSPYRAAAVRTGAPSITLALVGADTDSRLAPLRIPAARFAAGLPPGADSAPLRQISPPAVLIQGMNLSPGDYPFLHPLSLIWRGPLPDPGEILRICLDPAKSIDVAGVPYAEAQAMGRMADSP